MFRQLLSCLLALVSTCITAQSHTLTVNNGYGSGTYQSGDTVDIWSVAFYERSYFEHWSSDAGLLNDSLDWHTRLVMPDHDVTVTAVIGDLPDGATYFAISIQGVDTLKPVWLGLPGTLSIRGLVWMYHGTNGTGANFFNSNDMLGIVNKLMAEGYAIISLDCEEKTYDQDFNGDDAYRWDYTVDSLVNIDLRNVKAIRDTLIERGWIDADETHIAFGYSAGGAFATHIATQLQWRAAVSHNSAGVGWVPDFSNTPMLYSMTEHDDHPEVGAEAAIQAEANTQQLLSRGICSVYRYALDQPLYPERFNRDASITLDLSNAIFNELKTNGALDDNNYLLVKSDQLLAIIAGNPSLWPVLLSLTPSQRIFVADEIDETYATHRFNSDLAGSDIRFINSLCESPNAVEDIQRTRLALYPNPAMEYVVVEGGEGPFTIYDVHGKKVLQSFEAKIDVNVLSEGLYFVVSQYRTGIFIKS
jgi:dienelactone hydrolase